MRRGVARVSSCRQLFHPNIVWSSRSSACVSIACMIVRTNSLCGHAFASFENVVMRVMCGAYVNCGGEIFRNRYVDVCCREWSCISASAVHIHARIFVFERAKRLVEEFIPYKDFPGDGLALACNRAPFPAGASRNWQPCFSLIARAFFNRVPLFERCRARDACD